MTAFHHICFWFYFHPVGNSLVISLTWASLAIPGLLLFYGVIEPDVENKLVSNYFVGIADREEMRERTHIALYWFLCVGVIRALAAVWLSSSGYRVSGWSAAAQIWTPLMAVALAGDLIFGILYFVDPFVAKWHDSFDESDNLSAFLMGLACIRGIIFWIIDLVGLISAIMLIRKSTILKEKLMKDAGSTLPYSKMGTRSVDGRYISPSDYYSMDWRTKHDKKDTTSLPAESVPTPRPVVQRVQPAVVYRTPSRNTKARPASHNNSPPKRGMVLQRSHSVPVHKDLGSLDSSIRTWTEYSQDANEGSSRTKIPNPPPPPPPLQLQNAKPKAEIRTNGMPVRNPGPPVAPKPPIRKVLHALITLQGFQSKTEPRPTSLPVNIHNEPEYRERVLRRSESLHIPKPDYDTPKHIERNRLTHPKPDY